MSDDRDYYDRKVEKHTKTAVLFFQYCVLMGVLAAIYWAGQQVGFWP
jgi:hypothetical protein